MLMLVTIPLTTFWEKMGFFIVMQNAACLKYIKMKFLVKENVFHAS